MEIYTDCTVLSARRAFGRWKSGVNESQESGDA